MSKPINPFEEDQNHSFSPINNTSIRQQSQNRNQSQQQQQQVVNNICVALLATLLLISIAILGYRFVQLTQKEKENHFHKVNIQTNIQTGDSTKTTYSPKFQNLQIQPNPKDKSQQTQGQLTNDVINTKLSNKQTEQYVAQQSIINNQNPMEYNTISGNNGIKSQQQEILNSGILGPDEQESEHNSPNSQRDTQTDTGLQSEIANSHSIQEAQLLHQKKAYNIEQIKLKQLNNIKSELELHAKVKKHYQSLFNDEDNQNEEDKTPDSINHQNTHTFNPDYNSKQTLEDEQKLSQTKIQQNQNNQQIAQDRQQEQQPNNTQQQTQSSKSPNPISSKHITDKDMYDPIIRVKQQIEKKMNTNFDDLYYIKQGTNITEAQYKAAVQRMHLWKFYNPLTKKIQILDDKDVSYQGIELSTAQSIHTVLQKMQRLRLQQKLQYQQKYQISQYNQIPFCIIIPSYKNQDKYFRNLNSILQQDYQNYHIIYIDDASHDGTAEKVRSYLQKYKIPQERLLFIENEVNKKALPNIDYAARKLCNSGQIMAIIDGDDYLIGTQVFKIINAKYQLDDLLVLYTNHLRVHQPIYLKVGTCIDYPEKIKSTRSFRRFSIFPASHLRTFFVDLYWRISIRDLKDYNGEYFTAANDFAIMMPILQMAADRYQYFPELTYVYDAGTGFNNFQTKADKQARNFKITKRRYKYPKLERDLEFQKKLRAQGLMKPLEQDKIPQQRHPSSANRIRRNMGKH